jgi:23S rRNA (pseudouridine1915-N3)-methyltransferase
VVSRTAGGARLGVIYHIHAVGRMTRSPELELVMRYAERLGDRLKISQINEGKAFAPAPSHSRTVVLDETGKALSSEALAAVLQRWQESGARETRFLIGGADGHDDATRKSADLLLSFGPATWPHMLVRAMLAEQLYRCMSILSFHPYHRSGSS